MTLTICRENLQIQQYKENSPNHVYLFVASHARQPPATLSAVGEIGIIITETLGCFFDFERVLLLSFLSKWTLVSRGYLQGHPVLCLMSNPELSIPVSHSLAAVQKLNCTVSSLGSN